MNCEEVFVILTRGPFPSGARSDAAVEAHLQICPDCQRLAAALRPNDRGLQETLESEDTRALPGYWGNLLGSSSELAISLTDTVGYPRAQRLGISPHQTLSRGKNLNVGQFAAAVALGIVLAAALRTLVTVHAPLPGGSDPVFGTIINAPLAKETAHNGGVPPESSNFVPAHCPRALPIPNDRFSFDVKTSPGMVDDLPASLTVDCCTRCHCAGGTASLSSTAMVRLQQSCSECHK
jgi:hypothetical protein